MKFPFRRNQSAGPGYVGPGGPEGVGVAPPKRRRARQPLLRRLHSSEMGTGPILRTIITLGLPAAVAGSMQALYDLTDTIFVSKLGPDEISGTGLVGPILFCMFAIGQAVNMGIIILVSRHLGEKRPEEARQILNHGLAMGLVLGLVNTAVILFSLDWILARMGAHGGVLENARAFGQIAFAGVVFMQVGVAADGALRAQGNTVTPMKVGVTTNLLNVGLNWLLIYGLHMGVRGSATATLVARVVSSVVLVSRLWTGSSEIRPGKLIGTPLLDRLLISLSILWMGIPSSVGMLSMSMSMLFINGLLLSLNQHAVGVLRIAGSVEMTATVPVFALFSAVLPMCGYNLGARHYDRIRRIIWTAGWLGAGVMGTTGLIVFLFPAAFFGIFSKDAEMLPMGVHYLRIMMPAYPLIGATIMMSAGFQGLGKTWVAMLMQVWRNVILKVPFAFCFAAMWGVTGVWWSFPASTLASAALPLVWMWLLLRRLGTAQEEISHLPAEAPGEPAEEFVQEL